MRVPQVSERVKEAPAQALRAMFAGIGQLLAASDKLRGKSATDEAAAEAKAAAPETVTPETVTPETVTPETVTPETVTPETVTPETVTPETVTPETVTPETVTPETVTPETVTPETVTPETVTPETVTPETVTPETVTPETVTPETVTPETVTPETVDAGNRHPGDAGGGHVKLVPGDAAPAAARGLHRGTAGAELRRPDDRVAARQAAEPVGGPACPARRLREEPREPRGRGPDVRAPHREARRGLIHVPRR